MRLTANTADRRHNVPVVRQRVEPAGGDRNNAMQSIRIHAQAEVVWHQDRQRGERIDRGSPGWKRYFALIAEVTNSPEFGGVLMSRLFDPVVEKLIAAIRRALPVATTATFTARIASCRVRSR